MVIYSYIRSVAEIVKNASATVTCARSCSSEEETKEITGESRIEVVDIPVSSSARMELKESSRELIDNVKTFYSGSIAKDVVSLKDAQRVAWEISLELMF